MIYGSTNHYVINSMINTLHTVTAQPLAVYPMHVTDMAMYVYLYTTLSPNEL